MTTSSIVAQYNIILNAELTIGASSRSLAMENNSFSKVDGENHANEIFMDLFDAVVVVILLIALFRGPVVHNELKRGKKVHFGRTMHCLPQKLNSTGFFEKNFRVEGPRPEGDLECRNFFQKCSFKTLR